MLFFWFDTCISEFLLCLFDPLPEKSILGGGGGGGKTNVGFVSEIQSITVGKTPWQVTP